jgi:retron-type reverse transcriptase
MSVLETIKKCKTEKIKGALISLDIRKAFDSISHNYLKSCLRFFNFGENFVKSVMLLCTGRKAGIIFNNKVGKSFELKRGNAQGDTISPFLFNIGYQVLLLKINGTLQIESLAAPAELPANHPPPPAPVRRGRRNVFAFADDCTVLTTLKKENLDCL